MIRSGDHALFEAHMVRGAAEARMLRALAPAIARFAEAVRRASRRTHLSSRTMAQFAEASRTR